MSSDYTNQSDVELKHFLLASAGYNRVGIENKRRFTIERVADTLIVVVLPTLLIVCIGKPSPYRHGCRRNRTTVLPLL
jgi:hypothetical protein